MPPLAGAVGASLVLAFTHCWRSPLALARTRKKERERIEVLERRLSRALNPDSDASTEISVSLADLGGLTSAHEQYQIDVPTPIRIAEADAGKPHISITKALKHYAYDHTAATRAATRLRDADYTLHAFYADILEAFPEMRLYLAEREAAQDGENSSRLTVTSGISARDEYLRTIGAMFALYWLARIGIDGERGWSFGVDDDWAPRHPDGPMPDRSELRRKFYETTEWARLQQLLMDAGMLRRTAGGDVEVDVEVARSALALTAIHDIMKAEALLPTVSPEHASRCGFDAGDTINDHDIALAYLLDYHAHVLPSFAALSPAEQRSVRFTQSKMSFNHGWLVQAEAPPGALFGKFKQVVMDGEVQSRDIAFYFLHWLTDLAGRDWPEIGPRSARDRPEIGPGYSSGRCARGSARLKARSPPRRRDADAARRLREIRRRIPARGPRLIRPFLRTPSPARHVDRDRGLRIVPRAQMERGAVSRPAAAGELGRDRAHAPRRPGARADEEPAWFDLRQTYARPRPRVTGAGRGEAKGDRRRVQRDPGGGPHRPLPRDGAHRRHRPGL